jgi:hypothetical protein
MYIGSAVSEASLRKEKQMSKNANEGCPVNGGCDVVSCWLSKVGVNRSLLITLALLPFAWGGVVFVKDAVVHAWNLVTTLNGQ